MSFMQDKSFYLRFATWLFVALFISALAFFAGNALDKSINPGFLNDKSIGRLFLIRFGWSLAETLEID